MLAAFLWSCFTLTPTLVLYMTATYKCLDCNGAYETVKALNKHAKKAEHKAFRCGYCDEKFTCGDEVFQVRSRTGDVCNMFLERLC